MNIQVDVLRVVLKLMDNMLILVLIYVLICVQKILIFMEKISMMTT